ncbi:hypothetical protein ASG75_01200 [Rhodanobacter sp. Soil772]|nr:hypothetical protein ASG75_01200 [Rhodanobacter sp. Soil772]
MLVEQALAAAEQDRADQRELLVDEVRGQPLVHRHKESRKTFCETSFQRKLESSAVAFQGLGVAGSQLWGAHKGTGGIKSS